MLIQQGWCSSIFELSPVVCCIYTYDLICHMIFDLYSNITRFTMSFLHIRKLSRDMMVMLVLFLIFGTMDFINTRFVFTIWFTFEAIYSTNMPIRFDKLN